MCLTVRFSASVVIPAPAWVRPMWRAWVSRVKDWQSVGRYVEPGESRARSRPRAVYVRDYAVFRETYERLKTLYPALRFEA